MLLLKYIIVVTTAILSASAQTTSSSAKASTTKSLGKTSSLSRTSVAPTQTGTKSPSAPQPTGSPSAKKETRKLSEDVELALLKDVREKMTFLPYMAEERVFVAQQRQETLNVYAHVEEKSKTTA
ncbi:hypothetical protein DFS34DRAFT_698351 [Phlyctochytrium arcticum]|nr:hypothetical protein DFS34DRAFT_698351 [Phlyctochytrium arcticum]